MTEKRKLAAIMFTDIVGYTALMSKDEHKALQVLQRKRETLKPLIAKYNGEFLKEIGDGTLSSFRSAVEAVTCATAIQRTLKDETDFNIRIGIHIGDVVIGESDIFGDGVNIASRIEPLAASGGICISERVYDDVRNKSDINTTFIGERDLKNVDRPMKVYAITSEGLPVPRYPSAADILNDQKNIISTRHPAKIQHVRLKNIIKQLKHPKIALSSLIIVSILLLSIVWFVNKSIKISWARNEAIPEIERLVNEADYLAAFDIAREAEKYIPEDQELKDLTSTLYRRISVHTSPPDAEIYIKYYRHMNDEWELLGVSPIDSQLVSRGTYVIRALKEGFNTTTSTHGSVAPPNIMNVNLELDKEGTVPAGMVRVAGNENIESFFIDKYEVTNKQFKEFIDSGGYQEKTYWNDFKFVKNGDTLIWEKAIPEFKDMTDRPGPALWEAGDYPDGQGDYPVTGISWYEAVAYAKFREKSLPTYFHWQRAASTNNSLCISNSNFSNLGKNRVGSYHGLSNYGAYDMAGNAREWCWNESQNGRFILGGAWDDPDYMFLLKFSIDPFDRSYKNGFRCVKYLSDENNPPEAFQPLYPSRDFNLENPEVSEDLFQSYKNQFFYDPTELEGDIAMRDESNEDWIKEEILFNTAYNDERITAYLFLPKNIEPPYQTIVYFPGASVIRQASNETINVSAIDFLLKSGRAVMWPIYIGTYERNGGLSLGDNYNYMSHTFTDYSIKLIKDFRRSIDYLETRDDIAIDKLGYMGNSWGARMGMIVCAVEERIKAAVFALGGFKVYITVRPEVDCINYVSHVKIPILMLNGKNDYRRPLELSIEPCYRYLGSSVKILELYDTGHSVPRNELIKESYDFFDKYIGTVK
ncbi:SUMF1/EgtB/PvdO family nonheme iron enzyme [candidate division KSB1 bacterium]